MSLFAAQNAGAGSTAAVEIKCGKCFCTELDGGKKLKVSPDSTRKGVLILEKDRLGQMVHLRWKDRTTNAVEDDYLIFAGVQTIERVDTGREGDRVFLLEYKTGKRRFFFWSHGIALSKFPGSGPRDPRY